MPAAQIRHLMTTSEGPDRNQKTNLAGVSSSYSSCSSKRKVGRERYAGQLSSIQEAGH